MLAGAVSGESTRAPTVPPDVAAGDAPRGPDGPAVGLVKGDHQHAVLLVAEEAISAGTWFFNHSSAVPRPPAVPSTQGLSCPSPRRDCLPVVAEVGGDVGEGGRDVDRLEVCCELGAVEHVLRALRVEVRERSYSNGLWRVPYWSPGEAATCPSTAPGFWCWQGTDMSSM